MDIKIKNIILSLEQDSQEKIDYENDFTDVIILLENGETYIASFFTFKKIERQRILHLTSGEFLNGKYFWADRMVLVEACTTEQVTQVISDIINEGNFFAVFKKL